MRKGDFAVYTFHTIAEHKVQGCSSHYEVFVTLLAVVGVFIFR